MSSGQSTASAAAEATTAAEASYGSSEAAALRGQRRRRAEKLGGRKTQRQPANTETAPLATFLLLLLAISWPMALNAAASTERGNDYSQSVTAKPNFTAEQRTMLRQAFLRKFGLDNLAAARTSRTSDGAGKRSPTGKPAQVPDYIWALYEAHSTASPGLAPAQTIRHYGPSLVQAVGKGGGARLSFNLSATGRDPAKERVLRAELRLPGWRMTPNGTLNVFVRRRLGVVEEESAAASRNGADFGKRPWLELDGKLLGRAEGTADELHLSLYFPVGNGDVEEMLRTAALIVFSNEEGAGAEEATHGGSKSAAGEGDVTTKSMPSSSRRAKRHVATGSDESSSRSSNKNAAASSAQRGRRASSTSAAGSSARMGSTTHRHRSHHTGQCRRAQLYVDFADLNWQDWIMAPAGYEAYQCKGRCVHPMSAHLNTTNHAIVQSLIHSIDPSAAPAPSCVPVQMSAISILYRDVNDVIVVKTYADMRVDACGCH